MDQTGQLDWWTGLPLLEKSMLKKSKDLIMLEGSKDSRPVTTKSNTRLKNNKAVIGGGNGNSKLRG